MEDLVLPTTPSQLSSHFKGASFKDILKETSQVSKLEQSQQTLWKYSEGALTKGRPLDSVVICMAGASGAGKSSTINCLFEDETLCPTNSYTSETKHPIMLRKKIRVPTEKPPVVGHLSLIYVPGTFDTDSNNEVKNIGSILHFRKYREEFACRKFLQKDLGEKYFRLREAVFPNVILFTMSASDNRILGRTSNFRKSLLVLSQMEILDKKHVNLIILLTHANNFGAKKASFTEKLQGHIGTIRIIVAEVLGISNVDVVPVENCADDFYEKSGDFYILPNGEATHCNLFETMIKLFRKNGDRLGQLIVGKYFDSECPDRTDKPEVYALDRELTKGELKATEIALRNSYLSAGFSSYYGPAYVPEYNFQFLGYGYCPVMEDVKPISLICSGNGDNLKRKEVELGSSKFSIPAFVSVVSSHATGFCLQSFLNKENYESHLKARYSFESDIMLVVNTSSVGKWVEQRKGSNESSIVCLAEEKHAGALKLENPSQHINCPEFLAELKGLPENYKENEESENMFRRFFAKWGTHIVYQVPVGGVLQLNCSLENGSSSQEKLQEIEGKVWTMFGNGDLQLDHQPEELKSIGVTNINLQLSGGEPPMPDSYEKLTKSPQQLQNWWDSVMKTPTEIGRSVKLFPYYNLLNSGKPQCESLRQATKDYLENKLTLLASEKNRSQLSKDAVDEVSREAPKDSNCFPKGTMILLENGNNIKIEDLSKAPFKHEQLKTVGLSKSKLGSKKTTKFCTFLDQKQEGLVEYLVFHFANGKKLIVSECHLIFEYIQGDHPSQGEKIVKGKQAKYFNLGEMTVYWNTNGDEQGTVETPKIIHISKEFHVGAYSPLTSSGTFLADGFLVSSYANTNSFGVAQGALLPLKIWSMIKKQKYTKNKSEDMSCEAEGNWAPATIAGSNGIHPYAKFLISFRKTMTSFIG